MARKPILSLDGFDELLAKIQKAGGTIDQAADTCARKAADIADQNLRQAMQTAKVDSDLISKMPKPSVEKEANSWHVKVGYVKENRMDPDNLSEAYKVILLNYGTPHRTESKGQVKKKLFVRKAKRKSTAAIKKMEEETLNNMLGGLTK